MIPEVSRNDFNIIDYLNKIFDDVINDVTLCHFKKICRDIDDWLWELNAYFFINF